MVPRYLTVPRLKWQCSVGRRTGGVIMDVEDGWSRKTHNRRLKSRNIVFLGSAVSHRALDIVLSSSASTQPLVSRTGQKIHSVKISKIRTLSTIEQWGV